MDFLTAFFAEGNVQAGLNEISSFSKAYVMKRFSKQQKSLQAQVFVLLSPKQLKTVTGGQQDDDDIITEDVVDI